MQNTLSSSGDRWVDQSYNCDDSTITLKTFPAYNQHQPNCISLSMSFKVDLKFEIRNQKGHHFNGRHQNSYRHCQRMRNQSHMHDTVKKKKLTHVRSCDDLLDLTEVKLLLSWSPFARHPSSLDSQYLVHTLQKQEVLLKKNIFDPFHYFGSCKHLPNIHESKKFHSAKLDAMFHQNQRRESRAMDQENLSPNIQFDPQHNVHTDKDKDKDNDKDKDKDKDFILPLSIKKPGRLEFDHLFKRIKEDSQPKKTSLISPSCKKLRVQEGGYGRSPKNHVKENKEAFFKMDINHMQKMRVKLKIRQK